MIEQPMENRNWLEPLPPFYFFGPKNRERQRSSLKRAGSFTAST